MTNRYKTISESSNHRYLMSTKELTKNANVLSELAIKLRERNTSCNIEYSKLPTIITRTRNYPNYPNLEPESPKASQFSSKRKRSRKIAHNYMSLQYLKEHDTLSQLLRSRNLASRFNEQKQVRGNGTKTSNDKLNDISHVIEQLKKGKNMDDKPKLIISSSRKNELLKQSRLYLENSRNLSYNENLLKQKQKQIEFETLSSEKRKKLKRSKKNIILEIIQQNREKQNLLNFARRKKYTVQGESIKHYHSAFATPAEQMFDSKEVSKITAIQHGLMKTKPTFIVSETNLDLLKREHKINRKLQKNTSEQSKKILDYERYLLVLDKNKYKFHSIRKRNTKINKQRKGEQDEILKKNKLGQLYSPWQNKDEPCIGIQFMNDSEQMNYSLLE